MQSDYANWNHGSEPEDFSYHSTSGCDKLKF